MLETAARGSDLGGHEPGSCECLWCRVERPFDMPEQLAHACFAGDLVVFAGAGISTEARLVLPFTLYDHVLAELELDPSENLSFPNLMTRFEEARGRMALLATIKERLDYVKSFPNMDGQASLFHRELAGLFTVRNIVTTNWDDYFEQCCGAQPFVTDADWAYWKADDRKVFKLHGSVLNPGSVVATVADYKRCYRNLSQGLVGAKLKEMLSTKTVVFVGYSLRDDDLIRLYRLIKRRMGDLLPRSYVVTIDDKPKTGIAKDMHVIQTSGVHFLRELKRQFRDDEILPAERFEVIPLMRAMIREAHHRFLDGAEMRLDPTMLMCACYQDGLMDALDHIMANRNRGDYWHRCYAQGLATTIYPELQQQRELDGRWPSVAYIEGYINGLLFLIADDDERSNLPIFYVHGSDEHLRTKDDYEGVAGKFPELSPEAWEFAKHHAERLAPGVVFQHLPVLL